MALEVGELYARLRVDADQFNDGIDDSRRGLDRLGGVANKVFANIGKMAGYAAAGVAGISVASAAAAPVIAGAMGIAASFATAGIGVAAFGAVAVTSIGQVFEKSEELAKLEEKVANADTAKERAAAQKELAKAYESTNEAQRNAMRNLESFKTFWSGFAKQFEAPILNSFGISLNILQNIMKNLAPTIQSVADVVNNLLLSFEKDLLNGEFAKFFAWLEMNAAESLRSFVITGGNLMAGFFNLLQAFAPIGASMEEGLMNLSARFREWSAGLSESTGFQKFVEYAKTNGPALMAIFGNILTIAGNLITILAPLGTVLLSALASVTGIISQLVATLGEKINSAKGHFETFKAGLITGWQTMWAVVGPLVQFIGQKVVEVFQSIKKWWDANGQSFLKDVKTVWEGIWSVIQFVMPAIKAIVSMVFENIKGVIKGALDMIAGIFKVFAGLFTGDWKKMWEGVKQLLGGALEAAWNLLNLILLGRIMGGIKTFATNAVSGIKGFVTEMKTAFQMAYDDAARMFNRIQTAITKPIESARNIVLGVIDAIKAGFARMKIEIPKPKLPRINVGSKSVLGVSIPTFNIDWFKTGGIATGPAIAGVGEAGSEAIVPLQGRRMAPFADAVADRIGRGGNQNGNSFGPQTVIVKIGEREIVKAVSEPMDRDFSQKRSFSRRANGKG